MDNELKSVLIHVEIAKELEKIDWQRVSKQDIDFLKRFIPLLKMKGYYKNEEEKKINS